MDQPISDEQPQQEEQNNSSYGVDDTERKLAGSGAFITMFKLGIGPLLFSLINSFMMSLDLYFVKDFYGQSAVSMMSISTLVKTVPLAVGSSFLNGIIIEFSELLAKKELEKAAILYVDLHKVAIVLGIIVPLPLSIAIRPILRSLGMPLELENQAVGFLMPILWHLGLRISFCISVGAWIAIARILASNIIQILALVGWIVFDALLVYAFKAQMWTLGFGTIIGTVIATIYLLVRFFGGYEPFVPKAAYFKDKPIPELWECLRLSLPHTIQLIFSVANPLIMQSFLTSTAKEQGTLVATIYATAQTPYSLVDSGIINLISGLTPAATFAYHKNNYQRMRDLSKWACIMPYAILVVLWPMMVFKPTIIMGIWISDPSMTVWVEKIVPIMFYTMLLDPIAEVCAGLLNIIKREFLCTSAYVVKTTVLVITALILKYTTHDSQKVLYSMTTSDCVNFLYCGSLLYYAAKDILFAKTERESDLESSSDITKAPLI